MNVVMLSPGYPAEMAFFTRALAAVGARVIGVGDQPPHALPGRRPARRSPTTSTCSLADEGAVLGRPARAGPRTHGSTRWSACGSRT